MKNNKTTKLAIFLLALTMIAIMFVAGTFAKYTSQVSGSDSVVVAKWSIGVKSNGGNAVEIAVSPAPTISFDLFDTINDTGNSAAENDVSTGKIAPGTAGSFSLQVENSSEVTAKYGITYSVTNTNNVPIEFSTDGGTTWVTDLTSLNVNIEDAGSQLAIGASSTAQTVQWRWIYYVDATHDTNDTNLGILAQGTAPQVTVSATITATQVD